MNIKIKCFLLHCIKQPRIYGRDAFMETIKRLYVEKKPGCNIEAKHLLEDLQQNLGIQGLTGLRILNRYDIENIEEKDFLDAKNTIFSEPPVDYVYEETFPYEEGNVIFAVEYLPGQYDQRADSAMQCIQLISQAEQPTVAVAKVFVLEGTFLADEAEKIKAYCINPVDSREASLEKPHSLKLEVTVPEDVAVLDGFIDKNSEELEELRCQLGTAMSFEDIAFCQNYFKTT